ncbi:MAG: hypothetical protein WA087_01330 [Candidatus Saccharimonadales bacterium]
MQKTTHKYNLIIATIMALSIALSAPLMVSAQNTDAGNSQSGSATSGSSTSGSGSDTATQKKLQGQSLEKCQNREMAINNIMARIGDRGEKQIAVIDAVQQKVQTYYTENNISIANYDKLVANITVKKQTATTAMNTVRTMKGSFGCGNDDPKGVATQFKSQASTQSEDITAYKNAVHDLVVEIKTAIVAEED